MASKPNLFLIIVILACVSSCAGSPWDKQAVSGSQGPVYEIRTSRSSPPPSTAKAPHPSSSAQVVPLQVLNQIGQAKQDRIQEQLLKQTAMMRRPDFTDYKVGPEDLLRINFLDAEKLSAEARVNGQGEIRLLLVGDVKVSGLSPVEITRKLVTLYRQGDYLRNPQITVSVKDYRYQKVAVTGAVNKPDYYSLIGPRTLLEVLGMAGGLSDKAGEAVYLIRPESGTQVPSPASVAAQSSVQGADTIVVDLNRLVLKGETSLNYTINNGDVVFVPFAHNAFVLGAVMKPGSVPLKDNMTVAKAVAQTGGINTIVGSDNATIVRIDDKGDRMTIAVNLGQITKGNAEDVALQENDIVFVHESAARRFFYDIKSFFPGGMSIAPAMF